MSTSSILGGESAPERAPGRDVDTLGPSDSSDSGSDVQGERPMATGADEPDQLGAVPVDGDSDSDAAGTGERGSAVSEQTPDGADILPDHLVRGAANGIGGGGPDAQSDDAASRDASDIVDEGGTPSIDDETDADDSV